MKASVDAIDPPGSVELKDDASASKDGEEKKGEKRSPLKKAVGSGKKRDESPARSGSIVK